MSGREPRSLPAAAEVCEPQGAGDRRPAPTARASVVRELLEVLGVGVAVVGGAEPKDRAVLGVDVL